MQERLFPASWKPGSHWQEKEPGTLTQRCWQYLYLHSSMSKRERTRDIQVSLQLHPNIFLCCHISARRQKDTDYLTDALGANLAVTVRTLTGEGPQWVDTLLTGLAVMFVSLTLIDVCVLWGRRETGTRMSECGYCEQTHSAWQEDTVFLLEGRRRPLRSPHLHPTAENITSCWIMFAVSCRLTNTRPLQRG